LADLLPTTSDWGETIPETVRKNARALLNLAPTALPAEQGRFPSIILSWIGREGPFSAEIFESHIEVWPPGGQPIDLWYEDFVAGDALPPKFAQLFA
jgi:hypothetical protein